MLREIARDPERALVVIDPRRSETAELADIHLQVKPGTDAWCLAAILGTFVEEDLVDRPWLREHTTGTEEVLAVLRQVDVADCSRKCGVDEELIRATARRMARAASLATYEDVGVQQGPNSTLVSYLNKLQWILTGNFAKPGGVHMHSWLFPIAGYWHHIPSEKPLRLARTRRAIGDQAMRRTAPLIRWALGASQGSSPRRAAAERAAGIALNTFFDAVSVPLARHFANTLNMHDGPDTTPVTGAPIIAGLVQATSITEEILTDHPDRLRAMWVDASNPVHSLPDSQRMRAAFEDLELTVVVDVAMTETARCADYVLPATSQFEKWEGSLFTLHFPRNAYQARAPLMDRLPGTRPEPEIYVAIIDQLGVVDQELLDQLAAAARVGRKGFALALFSTLAARPELAGLLPYLLYKTLGPTLPEGQESLAVLWGMAHLCAIGYPDGVARAGHQGTGFDLGESLFAAIQDNRHGVTIPHDRYQDAWGYIHHDDKRIHAYLAVLTDELSTLLTTEPNFTSAEFPLTLSAGERRAFTANVIMRDPEWRRRDKSGALRVAPDDASDLGLNTGDAVRVVTEVGQVAATVEVSDMMQAGHISLPNGFGLTNPDTEGEESMVGTPPNELTGITRRDKFFLTPWHKNVPARIERLVQHAAMEDQ